MVCFLPTEDSVSNIILNPLKFVQQAVRGDRLVESCSNAAGTTLFGDGNDQK